MPLTFKLPFEHFDFNDEEFLNDHKQVYHFYNNVVVLEHKENKHFGPGHCGRATDPSRVGLNGF